MYALLWSKNVHITVTSKSWLNNDLNPNNFPFCQGFKIEYGIQFRLGYPMKLCIF